MYKDTHILKVKEWRKTFHANTNQRKFRVAILISTKADSEQEEFSRTKRGITYDKEVKSSIRHNNHSDICTKHQGAKICETKTDRFTRRNQEIHYQS